MARKPTPAPESRLVPMDEALQAQASAGYALAQNRTDKALALATELNYGGSLDPDVLENGAREAIRRMNMSAMELGSYFLLLKEVTPHGEFEAALKRLDFQPRAAQRYMAIARRFANATTSTHLARLGFSKIAELLPLDDSGLDDLIGEDGTYTLDDVDRMSVRELRAAVRDARDDAKATQTLLDHKNARIDDLTRRRELIGHASADDEINEMIAELAARGRAALVYVRGELRMAMVALMAREESAPGDAAAPREPSHRHLMAGWLDEIEQTLEELREEFGLRYIRPEQRELLYGVKDGELLAGGAAAGGA